MASLKDLVHPGEALAAVKILLGADTELVRYEEQKGCETVQGLMSVVLRVVAKCIDARGNEVQCRFIVKRLPLLEQQLAAAIAMGVFPVETEFFKNCAPILRKKCSDLPLVRCLFAHDDVLFFEDLCERGFETLSPGVTGVKQRKATLPQVRMIFRALAKFHAASLDVDWIKVAPRCFEQDVFFEVNEGKTIRGILENNIAKKIVPVLLHLYPGDEFKPYADWLSGPEMWKKFISSIKRKEGHLSVICHGDFWLHNIMFRLGPDGQTPEEVCLIDLQGARFAPQCTELQFFLSMCCSNRFRLDHEQELLRVYLEAFNAAANRTPDPITWEDFTQAYAELRLFGVLNRLSLLPILFAGELTLRSESELTSEQLEKLFAGSAECWDAVSALETSPEFREEVEPLLKELLEQMDLHKCLEDD